jgi:DNA-binding CsgD family transcriptional regulator/tetratricopeptide (TPR) repeat protein
MARRDRDAPKSDPGRGAVRARIQGVGRWILERDHELAELAAVARDAVAGTGTVVLVSGEAGIGKSSLIEAARAVLPAEGRLLVGYCDDLATRRTLGPLRDLAGSVGADLARALDEGGDRNRLLEALRVELSWPGHPAVLAIEDVHWADEATLDVLRYLARRIASMPAVLVLTYRDDEIGRDHPLQQLLGLISRTERVRRLPLARLSPQAVGRLSAASVLDPDSVYELTSGNPFFVTEVIAAGDAGHAPPTIVDAVLARTRTLDPLSQDALEQLAVVPSTLDRWLVDRLVPGGVAALAETERHGLVTVAPRRVAFRHELIRRAIADSLPAARRIGLNQRVLAALLEHAGVAGPGARPGLTRLDLAGIVHHAAEAGDVDAVSRYAPQAADEASRAGSHREAAAHLRRALDLRHSYPPEELADLLDHYAVECYTTNEGEVALSSQQEAVERRRTLGDPVALGNSLRWLSRIEWWSGHRTAAERAARDAVAVLENAGDTRRLAMAYSNRSQIYALAAQHDEAIRFGELAVALAREVGDDATLSHALNNVGLAKWNGRGVRAREGKALLEESLRVALAAGENEHACRAYVNIIWNLVEETRFAEAERYLTAGIELADCAEQLLFVTYMHVELAMLKLATGHWDEAVHAAEFASEGQPPVRNRALVIAGLVRARRGEPDATKLLTEAWEQAEQLAEVQRTGPAATARAEAAWLNGGDPDALAVLERVYAEARQREAAQITVELGYWMTRFGRPVDLEPSDHPFALQAAGHWREAAAAWRAAGSPYEYAMALSDSPDVDDLLAALTELDALGAEPMARRVRARLREAGVTRVPRGPVGLTRLNPAGLTERQLEVLRLLGQNLTNAEIAGRLVVSVRTVDNHVAAVLAKLGTRSRREAAVRAAELGVGPSQK